MPTRIVLEGNPDRILFEGFERAVERIASKDTTTFSKLEDILAFIGYHGIWQTGFIYSAHNGYAEPGYGNGEEHELVVLGDWNNKTHDTQRFIERLPELVGNAIEAFGGSIEWYDEWHECQACYKAVRKSPDSHFWKPYFYELPDGDGVVCANCVEADDYEREQYIECLLSGKGDTFLGDDLAKDGFTKRTDDLHQGFHPGMDESPEGNLQYFQSTYPNEEFVVVLEENSQFYYKFSIWGREKQEEDVQ